MMTKRGTQSLGLIAACIAAGVLLAGCVNHSQERILDGEVPHFDQFHPDGQMVQAEESMGNASGMSGAHFERDVNGEQLFNMYCSNCHDQRSLGDRPFEETAVTFAHARKHAYLTGQEYRKLIHFLRHWNGLNTRY